jgi:DUF2961 family protein
LIPLPVLLVSLAAQSDDFVDMRRLALLRSGEVRVFTSVTEPESARRPDAAGTYTLAESHGRFGRVARLWLMGGHERAKLRVFTDGQGVARISERIGIGFEDGRPPLLPFWSFDVDRAAGARVTYPPVLYQRGAAVTVSTRIDAYEIELVENEETELATLSGTKTKKSLDIESVEVQPGETRQLGPGDDMGGILLKLSLIPEALTDEDLPLVRLRITVDGEAAPGIDAALGRLFAHPVRGTTISGHAIEVSAAAMTLRLPVPYSRSLKIEIVNTGPRVVRVRGSVEGGPEPLGPKSARLRIREREGEAKAGSPFVIDEGQGRGHVVGFTLRMETADPAVADGCVGVDADGALAYRSVSLRSAFDAGPEFAKEAHATVGAGVSHVSESSLTAFCFRVSRAIPFRRSFRQWVAVPMKEPVKMSAVSFVYEAPSSAPPPASKPASIPASAPSTLPAEAGAAHRTR